MRARGRRPRTWGRGSTTSNCFAISRKRRRQVARRVTVLFTVMVWRLRIQYESFRRTLNIECDDFQTAGCEAAHNRGLYLSKRPSRGNADSHAGDDRGEEGHGHEGEEGGDHLRLSWLGTVVR